MDPQQTWQDMLDAVHQKQWDTARQLADDLHGWLTNKGFPPITIGDRSFGTTWHLTIATFTCLAVINRAEEIRRLRRARKTERKQADGKESS
ncbi:MAG: hypothetical protein R3C12_21555 [Planctomycetaceae bacterium]